MNRRLPADPMIRQLVLQARRAQLSRRALLGGGAAGGLALALAACTPGGSSAPTPATDDSANDPTLRWANWPLYIDEDDDGGYPTLDAFTERTGISVDYLVDVDGNDSYYARVREQLAAGQDIGADAVCLTEWMCARLVRQEFVQQLDRANIPNVAANLLPLLATADYDPNREYSVPWQGGFAGIAWNTDEVGTELRTVSDLWRPDLEGRVGVLNEMRDTIGLIMMEQGVDITSDFSADQFGTALDVLREHVESGQIRNVTGNSYIEDLEAGDTLAAICWSGDITLLNYEAGYEKYRFVIPESGGTIWNDSFVVPMGSTHKANVEALIDYYYEPEVAAEVAAWVNYITPVVGAQDAAAAIDPELAANPLIFPTDEFLQNVSAFRTLSAEEETEYGQDFQSVLLGA